MNASFWRESAGETDANPGVDPDDTGEDDPEMEVEAEIDRISGGTPAMEDGGVE